MSVGIYYVHMCVHSQWPGKSIKYARTGVAACSETADAGSGISTLESSDTDTIDLNCEMIDLNTSSNHY